MAPTYATLADLEPYFDISTTSPETLAIMLRLASILARTATALDLYITDADGVPTDPRIAAAFQDAVCIQVATWVTTGADPIAGAGQAAEKIVASKKLGTAAFTYDTTAATASALARARSTTELTPLAWLTLKDAGLCSIRPAAVI